MSAGVVVPMAAPADVAPPHPPAPPCEFCAMCWGQGKVWEQSRAGVLQAVPVPCDECFGTGRVW